MLTSWTPPEKGKKLGKAVLEALKKFPSDESISKTVVQAATADENGIKVFSISEVMKGKVTEAMTRATKLAIFLAESLGEGFNYKIETIMTAMEAMRAIGLEMPE